MLRDGCEMFTAAINIKDFKKLQHKVNNDGSEKIYFWFACILELENLQNSRLSILVMLALFLMQFRKSKTFFEESDSLELRRMVRE